MINQEEETELNDTINGLGIEIISLNAKVNGLIKENEKLRNDVIDITKIKLLITQKNTLASY